MNKISHVEEHLHAGGILETFNLALATYYSMPLTNSLLSHFLYGAGHLPSVHA